jgi:hypothetical protein
MADLLPSLGLWAVSAFAFGYGFSRLGKARWLNNTPTSRIQSAAQGFVEVAGTVEAHPSGLLSSKLRGEPCVWWSYTIREKRQRNKKTEWVTIDSGSSDQGWRLRDDTGVVEVINDGLEILPEHSEDWQQGNRRYEEQYLKAGDTCIALGWFEGNTEEKTDGSFHAQRLRPPPKVAKRPFFLSAYSEKDTVRRLQLDTAVWLVVSLGTAVAGLWRLL